MAQRLDEMINARLTKLQNLREAGIDPYPPQASRTHTNKDAAMLDGAKVTVVGRIMGWRGHGKLQFADLIDETGKIQIVFRANNFSDKDLNILKNVDTSDFIQVTGKSFTTNSGEDSVEATDFTVLCKATRPMPNQWYGLKDAEERYRKRYLDMILNPEVKKRLDLRSRIIQSIRDYLNFLDFREVETPTLQPIYGGGFARPFVTHHNVLDANFYLRISDEMYLKRLIVGGFEKVYEITKVFRNEGVDHDHNPEFTMFEAQIAYQDYFYGMDLIEAIIENAAEKVLGKSTFDYQGIEVSVKKPWKHLRVVEAIQEYLNVDPLKWQTIDEAVNSARKIPDIDRSKLSELNKMRTIGQVIAFVFEEGVEEKLIQPTIIYDYPVEISPLAKKCADPRFTQRFEMFAFGSELGNNYTELNDPLDLKQRFIDEKEREKAGFDEAHQTDYDYLEAIEHGFPPTCGIAIGIDRLVMLLTDAISIKEVIAFPLMRPLNSNPGVGNSGVVNPGVEFTIDPNIKIQFPGMFYAYTTISGVKIHKTSSELETLKQNVVNANTKTIDEIPTIKGIQAYRELFKATKVWGDGRRPSPEALLRRIAQGKGIYNINSAVDAYNLAVIETGIGLGGFNLNTLKLPVTLRFTIEGEEMHLLGDEGVTKTKAGEIAYADQEKLITLDVNYRDIDATKITNDTKDIILFADGSPILSKEEVMAALKKGAEYIQHFCGGEISESKIIE
jgi:lysyl-tRNA synthetase, class II